MSADPKNRTLSQQFREAALRGNLTQAKALHAEGIEDETLHCALYWATVNDQPHFVRWLIEDVKSGAGDRGPAALLEAIRRRNFEIVEMLTIPGRVPVGAESGLQYAVLRAALDTEQKPYDPGIMQLLLDRGARLAPGDQNIIDLAVGGGNSDALRRMIAVEPNIALALQKKLYAVCAQINPEGVRALLEAGADPRQSDGRALRVLLYSAGATTPPDRLYQTARVLIEHGADPTADKQEVLKVAVMFKNRDLVRYLLDLGLDIEPEYRAMRYNPLILSAEFNLPETLDRLHRATDYDDCYYHEALHVAAEKGHRDLVYQILAYGFDATSTRHFDIALAAAIGGQMELLQEFLAKGFKTDLTCPVLAEGVIEGDHGAMLDFLLDHGADYNKAAENYTRLSNRNSKPYAEIHAVLRAWSARGETVHYDLDFDGNLRHLRQPGADHGVHGKTGLLRMAKAGRFGEVVEALLRPTHPDNRLTLDDMLQTDGHGNTLLEILGARKQLGLLFQDKIWEERLEELTEIYEKIPPVYRDQFDSQKFIARTHQKLLRQKSRFVPKLGK